MTVGERIKTKREELGLSQSELATKMGYKTKSAICNVEKSGDNITTDRIVKFAKALDTTPAYLMGWEDTNNSSYTKVDEDFVNLMKAFELTEFQKKQVLMFAQAIKNAEKEEKEKHS